VGSGRSCAIDDGAVRFFQCGGTSGVDDDDAQAYFEDVGAEIMGAGIFGLHDFGDDPDWQGSCLHVSQNPHDHRSPDAT